MARRPTARTRLRTGLAAVVTAIAAGAVTTGAAAAPGPTEPAPTAAPAPTVAPSTTTAPRPTEPSRPTTTTKPATTTTPTDAGTTMSLPPPATGSEPQTSCTSVVHIGDSLSAGLDSAGYVGDPAARISVRYAAVGVRTLHFESSGGRSVVEYLDGQEDGEVVAKRIRTSGFHGCWVIALGTNDAANVAHGSQYGYSERIDRMMAVIGDDPVLWVDAKTTRRVGDYGAANMRLFNQALAKAHARYPGLKVYAWSDAVADDWFQRDGIHYTQGGSASRAALIAGALAQAFPADGGD